MSRCLKLFVFVLMLLVVSVGFCQELTADTPAVEMTTAQKVWAFIAAAFVTVLGFIGRIFSKNAAVIIPKLTEILTIWLKTWNHWRGSGVVIDTGMEVLAESGNSLAQKLADGILTDDEKKDLITEIKNRSTSKLKNLFGFFKKDLEAWAQEQATVFVGKLLYRGSSSSGLKTVS